MAPVSVAKHGPWVDNHKPKHLGQVIGNTEMVRKLAEWLRDWDDVVLRGNKKDVGEQSKGKGEQSKGKGKGKFIDNLNAHAALISGPPGIGKTTTATLVAKCNRKYKVMEFNASDARNKKAVEDMSKSLAGNHTLRFANDGKSALERAIIIMDECDGMSGGGDMGGMTALINMIKSTKNPIICICNERNDKNVRDLAQHCLDLRFRRPDNAAVAKRVRSILEGEGKRVDLVALEAITEACGHDIRQVMNQIQFFGTYGGSNASQKDAQLMMSPFDACTKLLSGRGASATTMKFERRMDMFYIDSDLMPLMVHENYLRPIERGPRRGESVDACMIACAKASELIALADTMAEHWELSSSMGVIGTIYPAYVTASDEASSWRAAFPTWIQKKTSWNKAKTMVTELHSRMRAVTTCSRRGLTTTNFHDLLHRRLLHPMTFGDTKACAAMLHAAGLGRDFFTDQAPAIRTPLLLEDGYKRLDGNHKHQLLQDLQSYQSSVSSSKRKKEGCADGDVDGEEGEAAGKRMKATTVKKKPEAKKGAKALSDRAALGSLGSWIPKRSIEGEEGEREKKATMILKFIEGHTNAVRRQVCMPELLGLWRDF